MGKYDVLFDLNLSVQDFGGKLLALTKIEKAFREKKYMERNVELKSKRKSDICYVIGLGPSLRKIDLGKLDGDSIVTNRFYIFDSQKSFTPTFYFMMDGRFFSGDATNDFLAAKEQYPDTPFILNGKYHKEIISLGEDKNNYFLYQWNGIFRANKEINICKVMPAFGNVVCGAIALAIGLGYKKICLLGCDFNSFASQKKIHCYEEANEQRDMSMALELFNYSFDAEIHMQLECYAKKHDITILNQTEGSLIDAYKREQFEHEIKEKN